MKNKSKILVINTGSTSTKLGYFEGKEKIFVEQESFTPNELSKLKSFEAQVEFRKEKINKILLGHHISSGEIDIFMCRGGLIKPVTSGVYQVNKKMCNDLKYATKQHASNLSAVIGYEMSNTKQNVYIADPVVVDEMQAIARYSGHKLFERQSIFHALNHKAVARKYAENVGKKYEYLNLIVVHLGGGISIGAHQKGKVIDVNQALDGEGPFSPERSGTLPSGDLIRMAFSEKYSKEQMLQMVVGQGGLISYLGTSNIREIEKNLDNNKLEILKAMSYQVAKYIGEMAVVLKGNIDAIILTGGIAHSKLITEIIKKYVDFLAPVKVFPGEDEIEALAYNGFLLLQKVLKPSVYE